MFCIALHHSLETFYRAGCLFGLFLWAEQAAGKATGADAKGWSPAPIGAFFRASPLAGSVGMLCGCSHPDHFFACLGFVTVQVGIPHELIVGIYAGTWCPSKA